MMLSSRPPLQEQRRTPSRPSARTLLPAALIGLLISSCAHGSQAPQPKPQAPADASAPAAASAPPESGAVPAQDNDAVPMEAPPASTAGVPAGPQPPDGKWLTDEEGRQYFVDTLPKQEGTYRRLDEKTVRTRWGIPIEVVKEDEKVFYYKVYKNDLVQPPERAEPTEVEKQQVQMSYAVDTPESYRLALQPWGTGLPESGQWRNGFDVADVNGDGHLDIVHGPARKSLSQPVIFLGDGKGGWKRWSQLSYPRLPYDYGDAAVGDFNKDGHPDIALGMHLRGIAALTSDGKGKFTDWGKGLDIEMARSPEGGKFSSRAVTVVDWNRDGRLDILALGEGPRLNVSSQRGEGRPPGGTESYGAVIYLNQGDGTWKRKDQGTGNDQIFGEEVVVGDFNGDGRPDFATGSNIMGRKALVNLGREDGGWDPTDIDMVRPSAYIRTVSAADFDGDGRDDLAVGYISFELATWRSGIDVFYSKADGNWMRRAVAVEEGRNGVTALDHGDLDGDGHLDLVALTDNGRTWVFLGDGKGFFTRENDAAPAFPGRCRGYHVEIADLDGDGRAEVVAGFAGENSALFDPERCPTGGGLKAWKATKAGETAPTAEKRP